MGWDWDVVKKLIIHRVFKNNPVSSQIGVQIPPG